MINSAIDQCSKPAERNLQDVHKEYEQAWNSIDPNAEISVEPTIEGALKLAKEIGDRGNGMQTLITGSLYLIGGALLFLESNDSV